MKNSLGNSNVVVNSQVKLLELFDSKVDYETVDDGNHWGAIATIGDRHVKFEAISGQPKRWVISFFEYKGTKGDLKAELFNKKYNQTGSGNELKVASFVIKAFKEFIEKKKPQIILFSADKSENRDRLYIKIIKAMRLEDWQLHRQVKGRGEDPDNETFSLVKDI